MLISHYSAPANQSVRQLPFPSPAFLRVGQFGWRASFSVHLSLIRTQHAVTSTRDREVWGVRVMSPLIVAACKAIQTICLPPDTHRVSRHQKYFSLN